MAFLCKAPRDCGCTLWDNGKACEICVENECLDLVETYNFKKCDCGSEEPPSLYGEGVARQYVEHKEDFEPICWSQFDGYVVECRDCDAITEYFEHRRKLL